jgi:hypothetical protein
MFISSGKQRERCASASEALSIEIGFRRSTPFVGA